MKLPIHISVILLLIAGPALAQTPPTQWKSGLTGEAERAMVDA
jgi:hypothetical protein